MRHLTTTQADGVPLASNQIQYSLLYRVPETNGVIEACNEVGATVIAYSPLAQGLLTGLSHPPSLLLLLWSPISECISQGCASEPLLDLCLKRLAGLEAMKSIHSWKTHYHHVILPWSTLPCMVTRSGCCHRAGHSPKKRILVGFK